MSADKDAQIAELEQSVADYRLCNNLQAQSIRELSAELEEAERKLAEHQAALDWFFTLVSESKGVAGYHLNGALAEWDEFELPQFGAKELTTLLAKAKEEGRREAVPEGWQVVPKEPTERMVFEAFKLFDIHARNTPYATGNDARRAIYKAMLTAAPKPEQPK